MGRNDSTRRRSTVPESATSIARGSMKPEALSSVSGPLSATPVGAEPPGAKAEVPRAIALGPELAALELQHVEVELALRGLEVGERARGGEQALRRAGEALGGGGVGEERPEVGQRKAQRGLVGVGLLEAGAEAEIGVGHRPARHLQLLAAGPGLQRHRSQRPAGEVDLRAAEGEGHVGVAVGPAHGARPGSASPGRSQPPRLLRTDQLLQREAIDAEAGAGADHRTSSWPSRVGNAHRPPEGERFSRTNPRAILQPRPEDAVAQPALGEAHLGEVEVEAAAQRFRRTVEVNRSLRRPDQHPTQAAALPGRPEPAPPPGPPPGPPGDLDAEVHVGRGAPEVERRPAGVAGAPLEPVGLAQGQHPVPEASPASGGCPARSRGRRRPGGPARRRAAAGWAECGSPPGPRPPRPGGSPPAAPRPPAPAARRRRRW